MDQKNFVVCGGSHGIGLGIVKRLQGTNGSVTVISRTLGGLGELSGVAHVQADVTVDEIDSSDLPDVVHGLVFCPGSINLGPVRGLKPDALVKDFELNVIGAISMVQKMLPAMKSADASSVVLFSTVAVAQGLPMHTSVAAVKGAIEGVTRSLAAELAPTIRVNCIAPSLTDTPLAEKFLSSDQKRAAMAQRHPLKRVGSVDDIASMSAFLLSDEATWISGQVIGVDGGMSTLRV